MSTIASQTSVLDGWIAHSAAARLLGSCDLFASAESLSTLERVSSLAGRLSLSHVVFDLAGHCLESSLDVAALLGRGLQEADTVVISHFLAFLERDCASVLEISLVSDQDSSDVVLSVLLDLTHPGVHGVEGVTVSDVVDNNDTVGTLVVAGCDGLEALLASSVPNLELADLVVDIDCANLEVDTDSGHEVLLELIIL